MTLFCPVTGLKAFTTPEWINQKVSISSEANFWIIGDSILYSLPKGFADLDGFEKVLALNDKVARFVSKGKGPFVQIQDCALVTGSNSEGRRCFIQDLNNNDRRSTIIFCNAALSTAVAIKIGSRFNTTGKQIHVVKHYKEAIQLALRITLQETWKRDSHLWNIIQCFDVNHPSLSPVEVISQESWQIQTPGFSNLSMVIDGCILHSSSQGSLELDHIPLIQQMREQCQGDMPENPGIKYIVVDAGQVKGGSRAARLTYMQNLKTWHQRFPFRIYLVYHANLFMKTALYLAKPLMPFKVMVAENAREAFDIIRKDRFPQTPEFLSSPKDPGPAQVFQADIDSLVSLISGMNWEQEGISPHVETNPEHPFYLLYQAIQLIKEEMDDLFQERRQLEAQLYLSRKMASLGTLTGGLAHDFNNILHVIVGNTELAMEEIPQENSVHEILKEIRSASLRAGGIIRQLLHFSHRTIQEFKPLGIVSFIQDIVKFLRPTAPIEIRLCLPKTDMMILADPTQISQVMINLCTNGLQAMEERGGLLEVTVEKVFLAEKDLVRNLGLTTGDYVKINVTDTGPGISPEIIDQIFDPYFTTRPLGKGSGLGLSVVHGIVKDHKGMIQVNSQIGKGTTFSVFFPMIH